MGAVIFSLLSLALYYVAASHYDIDSSAYLQSAHFFYNYGTVSPIDNPQSLPIWSLGYSYFIGIMYKLFGPSEPLILCCQVILSIFSGGLIFVTARRLFGYSVACVAFGLFCCNLGFLVFSQFILAEILLIFLLLLFFERFTFFLQHSEKMGALFFAGLFLALSTLVKLVAFYFFYLVLFFVIFTGFISWKITFKRCFIFLLPFYSLLVIFSLHNYFMFGQFCYSSNDTYNLYFIFHGQVRAQERGTTRAIEAGKLAEEVTTGKSTLNDIKKRFWSNVRHNPFPFIRAWLTNVSKIFLGLYTTQLKMLINKNARDIERSYFKMPGTGFQKIKAYITTGTLYTWVKVVGYAEVIWSLLRYVLCCMGVFFLWKKRQLLILSFFLSYIFYFSFMIAFDGTARYRFFFEFVLIMIAAYGIVGFYDCLKRRKCYE